MSHRKERAEKNCLNCNAVVDGRFCSICGQENVEPAESAWHLVTHFFNDITHFDGKFFSSLNLLLFRPGYLSEQYRLGRRMSYLNPIRMYVFTSFIFFLIFFSIFHFDDLDVGKNYTSGTRWMVESLDSTNLQQLADGLDGSKRMTRKETKRYLDSLEEADPASFRRITSAAIDRMDAASFQKFIQKFDGSQGWTRAEAKQRLDSTIVFQSSMSEYHSRAAYDSLLRSGKVNDGWFMQYFTHRKIAIDKKYKGDGSKLSRDLIASFTHSFPQMLFVSLPLFALFLKLLYQRHKNYYYVSHAIFSLHLYIFTFIVLLTIIGLTQLIRVTHWEWINYVTGILYFIIFVYEYKAMRNFYLQGRGKTFLKWLLLNLALLFAVTLIFMLFLLFSFLKI